MTVISPRLYFKDYYIFPPLTAAVLMLAVIWWFTLSKIPASSEQVYLHYNIIFGIDRYGPRTMLYYPLLFGLGTLVVNSVISYIAYKHDRVVARLIMVLTGLIMVLLLTGVVFIVGLNR